MQIDRISTVPPLPPRPADAHKGTFGRVFILGGNEEMIGAPIFAGTAALRMGSGLVQVALPRTTLAASLSITPELIGFGLGSSFRRDEKMLRVNTSSADAAVVGPGMGGSLADHHRLKFMCGIEKPLLFDAGALTNFATSKTKWWKWIKSTSILTPHPGEMKRLAAFFDRKYCTNVPESDDERIAVAVSAATTFNQIVVYKGHRTIVTDGTRVYLNRTGDSTLSKAGTGDILSGMIGSLLGQKMSPFDAACAAVHLHGRAGELAGNRIGVRSALAREIIDQLPTAIADYEREFG